MLKTYDKESDIPEGLRSEYKQSGTKWVPDLSDDYPVLVLNKTLIQEKGVVEARAKKLSSDLDDALEAAKTSGVPRGQVLVSKADGELLTSYKALSKTPDELKAALTEHETLKADSEKRTREDKLILVGKELGFDNVDAFKLLSDLPDFDIREKDGKKLVIALVKDDKGTITEKPAMEFLESSPRHSPFLPALTAKPAGITVNQTSSTQSQSKPGDPFAWAKEFAKSYSEQNPAPTDLAKSFAERLS